MLSALQLPLFSARPPRGYGVLTTVGRKTGKKRSRCVRAVRDGATVYLVAIKGGRTAWVKNALQTPEVRLRLTDGTHVGPARELQPEERERALAVYCERVYPFDYAAWLNWRPGRPSAERIKGLLREWFEGGTVMAVDVRPRT